MAADDTVSDATPSAVPADGRSLSQILRQSISFTRLQGICGTIAALMSIGGALGYIIPQEPPRGEVLAIVQEARSGKPIADATVEVLTLKDALVTMVPPAAGAGSAKAPMKEGTYRLRVSHPQYTTESRQIYVLAGQTAQIKVRLSPRPVPSPPPIPALVEKTPNSPYENIKKLFQ